MRFDGKVVFVTGAASGIGAATSALFATEGATVVGVDINGDGDDVLRCDVTDRESVRSVVAAAIARHGGLDVVCNVAGILHMARFAEMSLEKWQQVLAVNLTGPFLVSQAAMPSLVERKGCIVSVASVAGLMGQPYNAAYAASKGGLVQLTRSLAVEFADVGVRVNCVCPGGVDTPMRWSPGASRVALVDQPLNQDAMARLRGLMGGDTEPGEIAEAIAYLASNAARSISGAALVVDRVTTMS